MSWLLVPSLRPYVLLAGMASLMLNLALFVPALVMLQVFDRVFSSRSIETLAMLCVLAVIALGFGACMDIVRGRALAVAGFTLDRRLSGHALAHVLDTAAASGHARTDVLRDVAVLRQFLSGGGILPLFDAPWAPVFLGVIALLHPLLGVAAAVSTLVLVAMGWVARRLTSEASRLATEQARHSADEAAQIVQGAEVIAAMGMGPAAIEHWHRGQHQALKAQDRLTRRSLWLGAAARSLRQLTQIALLALGAWLVLSDHATAGVMVATTTLLGRALQPAEQLIAGWKGLAEARAAWQRLSSQAVAAVTAERVTPDAPQGRLSVDRLVFSLPGTRMPLLKGVSFTLAPGTSLGLVGASGCGKTTLLRLLLGLHAPLAGTVRLDGADVSQWDRAALGRHVGYLPQDAQLFAGTVAHNIARFGPVDSARVMAAARMAGVHELILQLPQGYGTRLGQQGVGVSGGQRRRIALARALYAEPRLLVLDEPDANLDAEGEAALAATLVRLKAAGTTVVVAGHRTSLMAQLDHVAVLREGTIELMGTAAAVLQRLRASSSPATRVASSDAPRPARASGRSEGAA